MKTKKTIGLLASVVIYALSFAPFTALTQNDDNTTNVEVTVQSESSNTNSSVVVETDVAEPEKKKGVRHEAMVVFGEDTELKAGDTAEVVVVIGGSAKIRGNCDECVVIGGNLDIEGNVRRSAVAIGGLLKVLPGATVGGDVVGVGEGVEISGEAKVARKAVEINFKGLKLQWLKEWLVQCVLKMRPLAPQVGWVLAIAAIISFVYLLIALVFPRPVQACVDQLIQRPATTFLAGLATKLLFPILTAVLVLTGVGILFIPFLIAALVLGFIVGKVALLEYLGGRLGRSFGADKTPVIAFLIGTVIVAVLYMIPVMGLITFCVISLWGLGAAVTATFAGCRRERPAKTPSRTQPPFGGMPPSTGYPPTPGMGYAASDPLSPGSSEPSVAQMTLSPALAFPRARFWERMAAAFLDLVIVGILGGLVGGPPQAFLVALAYFAGMWGWKGTTIGGIVLKLQVVRCDGGRMTFPVALVRGIAAVFSMLVLFLGFFWIAWDREKQGWHDKIAGTVVVRVPYSMPLVCI